MILAQRQAFREYCSRFRLTNQRPGSDLTATPVATQPTPQSRMAAAVLQLLRVHPLLQPLRDAGEPVLLSCHTRALWAHGLSTGPSSYRFEVRIETPEWWKPERYTFEDHARRLAGYLARDVRHQWDAQGPETGVHGC